MSANSVMRALRGATCLEQDDAAEMRSAVVELLTEMFDRNGISNDQLVSILFTATPDIHSAFPAGAARELKLADVPLICAQELDVTGAMQRVIRVLVHVNTELARADIKHVYLRGADALRQDIAQ